MAALAEQCVRSGRLFAAILVAFFLVPLAALAAPYADYVIDARTGQVLHENNANTRLHPASLTKMMTLYIAFEAIERGEISLDTKVTVSKHAASMPPSKLGLKAGQKIALRYLIRAAAIKSANDAATAIGEAIEGSEPAFAKRMTRTAKALGMTKTTFKNANGLTAEGHLSTAHDMTMLGRHLFYDYPQYYGLFSRRSADAGIAQVASTNRRFLDSYEGADGIKTGYTGPAGFNLTASAQRGNKRIIASIFGATSTANRNARMSELLDLGFGKAPNKAAVQKPDAPQYMVDATDDDEDAVAEAIAGSITIEPGGAAKTIRVAGTVQASPRPRARPTAGAPAPADEVLMAALPEAAATPADPVAQAADPVAQALETMQDDIEAVLAEATDDAGFDQSTEPQPETLALADAAATDVAERAAVTGTTDAAVAAVMASADTPRPAPRVLPAAAPEAAAPDTSTEEQVADALMDAVPAAEQLEAAEIAVPQDDLSGVADAVAMPADAATMTPIESQLAEIALPKTVRPEEAPLDSDKLVMVAVGPAAPAATAEPEVVTRISTSGGAQWGIRVGNYPSRYEAERQLLQVALLETGTLGDSLRKVVARKGGFDATFLGLSQEGADLACRRLAARGADCAVVGP